MRLEEWQRFIETQFLEEGSEARTQPSEQAVQEEAVTEQAESDASPLEIAREISVAETTRPAAPSPEFEENVPENSAGQDHSSTKKPTLSRSSGFRAPDMEAIEIPSFERYLPPFRQVAPAPSFPQKPADDAASVTPIGSSDSACARNKRVVQASDSGTAETPLPLSASAELWANVPKHIQTLLALERADEDEVAQNSYKRPFAEKRRELIERLLNPVLSLEDTARLLNVCPATVRRYTNRGLLVCHRKEPERTAEAGETPTKETRQRRFRLSDILAFLETQQADLSETDGNISRPDKKDAGERLPAVEERH